MWIFPDNGGGWSPMLSEHTQHTVIDGLLKNGRAEAACGLFYELRRKGQLLDGIAYSIMVREFCEEGVGDQVAEALELVKEMEQRGFVVDLVTITSLLIGFNKSSKRWDLEEQIGSKVYKGRLCIAGCHPVGIKHDGWLP
jgi:pentatricopeptide repeat protein